MELTEKQRTEIEKIISRTKCPKDFECYKSEFEKLCKARNYGLKDHIECLEENSEECNFSLAFGKGYLCKCALRIYAAKNLRK